MARASELSEALLRARIVWLLSLPQPALGSLARDLYGLGVFDYVLDGPTMLAGNASNEIGASGRAELVREAIVFITSVGGSGRGVVAVPIVDIESLHEFARFAADLDGQLFVIEMSRAREALACELASHEGYSLSRLEAERLNRNLDTIMGSGVCSVTATEVEIVALLAGQPER